MKRLFRFLFKLGILAGIGVGIALLVKKLTATPDMPDSPLEPWPPLDNETITSAANGVADAVSGAADKVSDAASSAADKVSDASYSAADKVKDTASSAADKAEDAADAVSDAVEDS